MSFQRFIPQWLVVATCALLLTACAHQSEDASLVAPSFGTTNAAPAYPVLAVAAREEGKVVLHVSVTSDGLPVTIEVKQSSGYARLDRAAVQAVQKWKFKPATLRGQPIAATLDIPISFQLKDFQPPLNPEQRKSLKSSTPPTQPE